MKRTFTSVAIFILSTLAAVGASGEPQASAQTSSPPAAAPEQASVAPMDAILQLVKGNQRFSAGHSEHPRQTPDQRAALATAQHPFAIVIACADSRVSPEILFDQGLGDLFVVRVAGNVVDDHSLGSIEYAVEHLHVRLIVVVGHERCGAIAAARDVVKSKGHAEGHVESLVAALRPAVEATANQDADATCKANVANVVKAIKTSEPLVKQVASSEIAVTGAYYDLDSGVVEFLDGEK